jgi:hypothetical protein
MNAHSKFVLSPHAMSRTIGEETVILDLESGTYFGLDPVGAQMWHLLEQGKSFIEVRDAVFDEYEVERDRLEADLLALIGELAERKLIIVNEG